MKKIINLLLLCILFFAPKNYAQNNDNGKVAIAILPFISKSGNNISTKVSIITDMVTAEFVSKQRFNVIDREKFSNVINELKEQQGAVYINSDVVKQGSILAAKYFITGIVTEFATKQVVVENTSLAGTKITTSGTHREARYSLVMSFQIIEIETGATKKNIPISLSNYSDEKGLMCNARKEVRKAIRSMFPFELKIIDIESRTKKGLPAKVFITGGEDIFGSKLTKEECADEADDDVQSAGNSLAGNVTDVANSAKSLSKIFFKGSSKTILLVYIKEKVGDYDRDKEIGQLKYENSEGQIAICTVLKGAQEIDAKLAEGKKLLLKIIKN